VSKLVALQQNVETMNSMPSDAAQGTRSLRVCHLAYTFYETDNRVVRYARALIDRGDEVDVIALKRDGQARAGVDRGVHVLRLQRRTKNETGAWTYLPKLLLFAVRSFVLISLRHLRRRYDVIHVHNIPDFLVFSAVLAKLMGARVILDIHDVLPELFADKFGVKSDSLLFRLLCLVERWSCALADTVLVANHIWHDRLTRRSVPADKCLPLVNFPDLRVFTPRPEPPADRPFVVVYPGSLSRHQGIDVAIRAFARVHPRLGAAEFHIYGEGPARAELMALAAELGVSESVKFHQPVPVEDVAHVLAMANVGIEPKLASGFGTEALSTKILEMLASGVPVIASRTRAHDYYFDDTLVTFFTSGDVDSLSNALLHHYQNRRRSADAQRGVLFAHTYDWRVHVAEYYRVVTSGRIVDLDGSPALG